MVVRELKKYFAGDEILEGDKLPTEKQLCQQLDVGRSTVREAIKALQVMGHVRIIPGRGAFLAKKSLETPLHQIFSWFGDHKLELVDIIDVRLQLEPLAVRLVIERGSSEEVERIDALRLNYEKSLEEMKEGGVLARLDAEFHQAISEASHNSLLVSINRLIMETSSAFRLRSFSVRSHAENAVEPHRRIVAAIKAKDVRAAQRHMKEHLFKALEDMSLGHDDGVGLDSRSDIGTVIPGPQPRTDEKK